MELARITVFKNKLEKKQLADVTAGMVGAAVVFEQFSPEWKGLTKTAVFRTKTQVRDVTNVQENVPVEIPWELLEAMSPSLMVGICGTGKDGAIVIPSIWCSLGKVMSGAAPVGRPSQPATPDWAAQIELQVNQAIEKADAAAPLAASAEAAAESAGQSAQTARSCADRVSEAEKTIERQAGEVRQNTDTVLRGHSEVQSYCRQTRALSEDAKASAERARQDADRAEAALSGIHGNLQETDPTVPDWAKQASKPAYTPEEIGAQPAGDYALLTQIPTRISQLGNDAGYAAILPGTQQIHAGDILRAQAVSPEGIVTRWEAVSPQRLTGKYELIDTVTAEADSLIRLFKEPDGTPYRFSAVRIVGSVAEGTGSWNLIVGLSMEFNDILADLYIDRQYTKGFILDAYDAGGFWDSIAYRSKNEYVLQSQKNIYQSFSVPRDGRSIRYIYSAGPVKSRTTLKIYAIREEDNAGT